MEHNVQFAVAEFMSYNVIRLPTCRSEEAGERSDPAPERRHVPKGKPRAAKRSAAQRQESVIRRDSRRIDAACFGNSHGEFEPNAIASDAVMSLPMMVGAESCDVRLCIGPTLAQRDNMVRFQIERAIL